MVFKCSICDKSPNSHSFEKIDQVDDITILQLSLSGGYNMIKYKVVFYPDRNIVSSNKNTLHTTL